MKQFPKIEAALLALITSAFKHDDDRERVAEALDKKHVHDVADLKDTLEDTSLAMSLGLEAGEIVKLKRALGGTTTSVDPRPAQTPSGSDTGVLAMLAKALGHTVDQMTQKELLTAWNDGNVEPEVIAAMRAKGITVVLVDSAKKIAIEQTIKMLAAPGARPTPGSVYGRESLTVKRLDDLTGERIALDPWELSPTMLVGDFNNESGADWKPASRNFRAFVRFARRRNITARNDVHDAIEDFGRANWSVEELGKSGRWVRCVAQWRAANEEDESLEAMTAKELFPSTMPTNSVLEDAPGRPFDRVAESRTGKPSIDEITDAIFEANDVFGVGNTRTSIVFEELGYKGRGGLPFRVDLKSERGTDYNMVATFYTQGDAALQTFVQAFLGRLVQSNPMHPAVDKLRAILVRMRPSSSVSIGATPNRDAIYERLTNLLPAQFEQLVFKLSIPSSMLSGPQTALAARAIEVIRYCEPRPHGLYMLQDAISSVMAR